MDKCQNMLIGTAIGDAFGVAFEGKSKDRVSKEFQFNHYNPGGPGWKSGSFSDDTQMSIAIVELLISGEEFNKINLAKKFLEVYRRDPHQGYGNSVKEGLLKAKNTKDFLKIIPGNSLGNGACMRATSIGALPDIKDVIKYAKINAEVTHNTTKAIVSSVCIAAASHYFYYNLGNPQKVFDYCIKSCKGMDKESILYLEDIRDMKKFNPEVLFGKENKNYGVPVEGMHTAGAVLYIISRYCDNPEKTLEEAILLGGDTDTVASISLGIVSINKGIKKLPFFLFRDLENNGFGRDYLIELGKKLYLKYPAS